MDIIMLIGSFFFFFLFAVLVMNFTIFLIALCKKKPMQKQFTPTVSVIIPCYNEEQNIADCLNSLLACKYPKDKLDFIVVDDGSTDNTVKIVKKRAKSVDVPIKILNQDHKGKVDALNLASKQAKGEFLINIDADTVVTKEFITHIVQPFIDEKVGASSGAVRVKNNKCIWGMFQNIEYHQNNLIRNYFSKVFRNGIWFFGSLSCYRKSVLAQVGYFKKDTEAEDMDIALDISKAGFFTINIGEAIGYTVVPTSYKELFHQRARWWSGGMQSLIKHHSLFANKQNFALKYVQFNHFWWTFYAPISLLLIIYQVHFWMPYTQGALEIFFYLFRWFSLAGPVYVLYKIPEWGLNYQNIFGVLSGLLSTIMILVSLQMYKDKLNWRNILVIFFYFPYTIVLNSIIIGTLFKKKKNTFFIK